MTQVLVTRPLQDAATWILALKHAGLEAVEFPLLQVNATLTSKEAPAVLQRLQQSQAVMFVSANAVRFLAEALKHQAGWVEHFTSQARVWCTGPGTAAALLKVGIPASQIDQPAVTAAQLDSEALWAQVQKQATLGFQVLFIRGTDETGAIAGRDWLVQQLEHKGASAQAIAAYQRVPTPLTALLQAQVQQHVARGAVWLFSSSACLQSLVDQCHGQDWSTAKAVVTHPRIAALAQQLGWPRPSIAAPGLDSMLASIKSLA